MRKITILFFVLLGAAFSGNAQYSTEFGLNLGASNYLGDMGGEVQTARPWVVDMKPQETRWALGGFVRQRMNKQFYLEAQFNWVRICGADSLSTNHGRVGRNLYFRNDIEELSALGDWVFWNISDIGGYYSYKSTFSMYLTAGVSVFHHEPMAMYEGEWVSLEPLHTSGVSYSLIQPGVPMGIGLFYTFNRQYRIGWNFIATKTFTNELDDVGLKYVQQPEGSEAAYMSNRTLMVPGMTTDWAANYLPGNKRGDPQDQWFLTTQLSFSYILKGSSHFKASHYLSKYRSRSSY
jgi:hypothetical protein